MWYFSWILGVSFVCAFAVLHAMWLELHLFREDVREKKGK